ncbi:MAG: glycosyl hydrolase family 95 catalytic domain-containing protein [Ilumatobacteraceae bacterium]
MAAAPMPGGPSLVDPHHALAVMAAARRERATLGAAWVDGTPLGNGRTGAVVWGDDVPTLTIDHAEFWDRRAEGAPTGEHPFSAFLTALDGGASNWPASWPVHLPRFDVVTPTRLPPSRVRLHGVGRVTAATHDLDTAALAVATTDGRLVVRVLAGYDVVLVEGSGPRPTPVVQWCADPANWEERQGGQPPMAPHPVALFAAWSPAVVTGDVVDGAVGQPVPDGGVVAAAWALRGDDERWWWAMSLASARDGSVEQTVAVAAAARDAVLADPDAAVAAHEAHWRSFHARSWVSLPDPSVQSLWCAEMAKLGGAMRADGPPLGLQGPWSPDGRMPPWGGDLHHNVNVQLSYAPVHVTNHGELADSLHRYVQRAMPEWRELARSLFGVDGLFVPSATDDDGRCRYEWAMVNLAFSSGPWLAQVLHTGWLHSADIRFRDEVLLPFMEGVVVPLSGVLEEGADGRLHLPRSYSPELVPVGGSAWGPDATIDLALLGWLFDALADLLDETGREGAEWRDRAARLAPLPADAGFGVIGGVLTGRAGGLRVRADAPLDRSHRHHSHLIGIHPLRRLTADAADVATRSLVDASIDNLLLAGAGEWVGFSVPWAASIAAYAGRADLALGWLRDYAERWVGPSTFHVQTSVSGMAPTIWNQLGAGMGGDALSLEAGFAFVAAVCDLLVHDHGGVVRIAPAVPTAWGDLSFAGLRAAGGFEVAARVHGGEVVALCVSAHHDAELVVRWPGPGGEMRAHRAHLTAGDRFTHTEPGWTIDDIAPIGD